MTRPAPPLSASVTVGIVMPDCQTLRIRGRGASGGLVGQLWQEPVSNEGHAFSGPKIDLAALFRRSHRSSGESGARGERKSEVEGAHGAVYLHSPELDEAKKCIEPH